MSGVIVEAVAADERLKAALTAALGDRYRGWTGQAYQQRYGGRFIPRRLDRITRYVLHHSTGTAPTAASIWRYHVQSQRWATAGYHLTVDATGNVELLIPPSFLAYCVAEHNPTAVCIVALGDYERAEPSLPMLASVYAVFCALDDALGGKPWRSHNEVQPGHTLCCGKHLIPHLKAMRGYSYGAAIPRPALYP